MEAAVVLDRDWRPIHFHAPGGRTIGSLPDSHDLWSVLWENRTRVLGVAHSHPGGGVPSPSHTDVTTFAAVDGALGVRLIWPIVTVDAARTFVWGGLERLAYVEGPQLTLGMQELWVAELLRLSE
jgi:proteasome lid subunit RPN8/RPN11